MDGSRERRAIALNNMILNEIRPFIQDGTETQITEKLMELFMSFKVALPLSVNDGPRVDFDAIDNVKRLSGEIEAFAVMPHQSHTCR